MFSVLLFMVAKFEDPLNKYTQTKRQEQLARQAQVETSSWYLTVTDLASSVLRRCCSREALVEIVSCAMPACDPYVTDRPPDRMRYSCFNKQSGNQGFKIGQDAPLQIQTPTRIDCDCKARVQTLRRGGRGRSVAGRPMPASRWDEIFLLRQSVWRKQDIKIGRTSNGPRNTIYGGSSKVGCVIGRQGAEIKRSRGQEERLAACREVGQRRRALDPSHSLCADLTAPPDQNIHRCWTSATKGVLVHSSRDLMQIPMTCFFAGSNDNTSHWCMYTDFSRCCLATFSARCMQEAAHVSHEPKLHRRKMLRKG